MVLARCLWRIQPNQSRASLLRECKRAWGVITVGVGD